MSQLSPILRSVVGGLAWWCPGCAGVHVVPVAHGPGGDLPGARWFWNGDVDAPVFTPSVLTHQMRAKYDEAGNWAGEWVLDASGQPIVNVCHSFVGGQSGQAPGRIEFLGDCTHALAGQTVPMVSAPWWKPQP